MRASVKPTTMARAAAGPFTARTFSFMVSGVASILLTRTLIERLGPQGFSIGSMVISLAWVLPLLVDGSRSVIVNTVARGGREPAPDTIPLLIRATLIQLVVAVGILLVTAGGCVGIAVSGWGGDASLGLVALTALTGMAMAVSAACVAGPAALQGAGYQTVLSALPAIASLAALGLLYAIPWPQGSVVMIAVTPLGAALLAVLTAAITMRVMHLPVRRVSDLWRIRGHRPPSGSGSRVFMPATIITFSWVMFTLSDRYLLAPSVDAHVLAGFIVIQLSTAPFLTLGLSAAEGAWPYVLGRDSGMLIGRRELGRGMAFFALLGVGLGAGLALVGPWVARIVFNGPQDLNTQFAVAGGYVTVVTLNFAAMSFLRTEAGFVFLSRSWLLGLAAKLGLGFMAGMTAGITGLILASTVVMAVMLTANLLRIRASRIVQQV